jgi:CO/xanthine dehydrogenase FAD-binding subunit
VIVRLNVKAPSFEYDRVTTVQAAVSRLAANPDAKLLAGGQSLVPLLNMRLSRPTALIDLGSLTELQEIIPVHGGIRLGAMVRQREAELSAVVADACPLLVEALRLVAHPQIRNQGTIGGSLAHADPAAELPAAVLALDGVLHATGPEGERTIAAHDFFQSYLTTALDVSEVLTDVTLPVQGPQSRWSCREVTRRPGDFPLCGAATVLRLDQRGRLADVRVALFGVADRPVRATASEAELEGAEPTDDVLAAAAAAASAGLSPMSDIHATATYRRRLAAVMVRRTLAEALGRGGADVRA